MHKVKNLKKAILHSESLENTIYIEKIRGLTNAKYLTRDKLLRNLLMQKSTFENPYYNYELVSNFKIAKTLSKSFH